MSDDLYFYTPTEGHGLGHNPFNAIVAPRPIGWIATVSPDGRYNLAPYSFFNAFNYTPPIVGFSSVGAKDTLKNAEATGEFVWNLATEDTADAMNASSASVEPGVDEFELAGLTPVAARHVGAPRIAEAPVAFECRVSQIVRLTGADGTPADARLVLGEVVGVHIARRLIRDGVFDTSAAAPILRAGGSADYYKIGDDKKFEMARPDA